jgi:hypothetical protein
MFSENQGHRPKLDQPRKKRDSGMLLDWASLPVETLLQYRDEITAHLPALALKDIDLESELLAQFHSLRVLQTQVLNDDAVPLNQRAQLANSVGATLDRLIDAQEKVFTQERMKSIENLLIRHIKLLPEATAEEFLKSYEAILLA